MRKKTCSFGAMCLFIIVSWLLFASVLSAKAPDADPGQREAVVAVYVNDKTGKQVASATGVVVDRRGVVATSCYLIPRWIEALENTLFIKENNGSESQLEYLISRNCDNGVALIKVRGDAYPAMNIPLGARLRMGELVSVISATGSGITATEGRVASAGSNESFQVTVPISPKRDGSPVLNAKGEFIGIATFRSVMKRERPTVFSSKNIAKELNKYKHLITGMRPSPDTPRIPSPPPSSALPLRQGEGKEADAERFFAMGQSYEKANMMREAIEAYEEAIRNKPDYSDAYVNLGLAYYKSEKYAEAAEAYKQAININPNLPSLYGKLGATYIILGEYAKALDAFKQSVRLDPTNSETHYNLGVAFVIAGDKDGAIGEYLVLKDLDRKYAEKLLELIY